MDKKAYFERLNGLNCFGRQLYYSKEIAQQKKAATSALNGLIKLHNQVTDYIDDEEKKALKIVIKLIEEAQQVRQVATSSVKRAEKEAQARAAKIEAAEKTKIEQRFFGDCSNDDQVRLVINAFVEFANNLELHASLSAYGSLDDHKRSVVNEIYDDQNYLKRFSFDRFDAFCDQRMAEASYMPELAGRSDDAAQEFSL